MKVFAAAFGDKCKEVVQLLNWCVHAHVLNGNVPEATQLNEKALALAKSVFGDLSFELWRTMLDKVYLIQHSVGPDVAATSAEARKAFSMAERVETHAAILLNNLQSEKVDDDRVTELSIFAPPKREYVLRPEEGADGELSRGRRGKRSKHRARATKPTLKKQGTSMQAPPINRSASTNTSAKGILKPKVAKSSSSVGAVG